MALAIGTSVGEGTYRPTGYRPPMTVVRPVVAPPAVTYNPPRAAAVLSSHAGIGKGAISLPKPPAAAVAVLSGLRRVAQFGRLNPFGAVTGVLLDAPTYNPTEAAFEKAQAFADAYKTGTPMIGFKPLVSDEIGAWLDAFDAIAATPRTMYPVVDLSPLVRDVIIPAADFTPAAQAVIPLAEPAAADLAAEIETFTPAIGEPLASPRTNSDVVPEVVIVVRPLQRGGVLVRFRARPKRPGKRYKDRRGQKKRKGEQKLRGAGRLPFMLLSLFGELTEMQDTVDALVQNMYLRDGSSVWDAVRRTALLRTNAQTGFAGGIKVAGIMYAEAFKLFADGEAEIDLVGFGRTFLANQLQDAYIGKVQSPIKSLYKGGSWANYLASREVQRGINERTASHGNDVSLSSEVWDLGSRALSRAAPDFYGALQAFGSSDTYAALSDGRLS